MRSKKKQWTINICAILLALVFLFPIYVMILSSLKPSSEIFKMSLIPDFSILTLDNFREVLDNDFFFRSMLNSFIIATSITIAALFFHSMAGYALAKMRFPGKKLIFGWFMSTMMIPFAVIMIPLFIIVRQMGLLNTLWAVILPLLPNAYGIFLYRQFFMNIPDSLMEAAKIDGLSNFKIFWKIYMPLSKPITVTLAITFFVTNWNTYLWPLIVTQKQELWVIQVAMANFKQEHTTAWNLILAGAVIAALPTVILFFIFQKYIKDGIKTSGMKE
ncbi:multiple sugar transport system permease protein [Enterococcus sp. PF1-24]|uniref:carbohydrate ABC transporter permease n=1 Tax=unclassified Enterococcus TaxID=2608891 RepID=UPI00247569E9|nr:MULTISPECIES: carbohydrate ABC transporter permease [unclassified Enterococcus]MDH6363858.1 multiple sugar transport system permease protein [Enterococcus sp. PFB1-1]MDH6400956.1 multiple sugar transport system permease protein [Enterococcus sp. PF1-24]